MSGEEYEFYIDSYKPATIPMARLAEYLRELAALLGNQDSVHFSRLKSGSVGVVARVEQTAVPKVRVRLQSARDPNAPDDLRRTYKRIDGMLREDNAVGRLARGTTNVVKFPGREGAHNPRMGPFTENANFDGRIVRAGGRDETAHVLIEVQPGEVISAECSRDLAVQLAKYLYGEPVRVSGTARWERTEIGEWELKAFRAKEFSTLKPDDLSAVIARLRNIDADWKRDADPLALMRRVRGGNGEAH